MGRSAVNDGAGSFISHTGAAGIPAGHREYNFAISKIVCIPIVDPAIVAVYPQTGFAIVGRNFVSRRARIINCLIAAFGFPQICQILFVPVTCTVRLTHFNECSRIGNGKGSRFRAVFNRDSGCSHSKTRQRCGATPLIVHTIGLTACSCCSSLIQSAQVAVHDRQAVEGCVSDVFYLRRGHPDVPAPENGTVSIFDCDEGVAGSAGGSKADVIAVEAGIGNDGAFKRSRVGIDGLPKNYHGVNITHAFVGVTLHSLELVGAGGGDDVAVGAFLFAQVGHSVRFFRFG